MALTPKQMRFCTEYVVDLNGTQAAIRAGYSRHTASEAAYDLLRVPHVLERIEKAKDERSTATGIDAAWVLTRLADEAAADVGDIYDDDGALLPVAEWPLIWRQGLVTAIDVEVIRAPDGTEMGIVKKIKISDRVKRLELIGRHVSVKAFEDRISVGVDDVPGRMARALQRMNDDNSAAAFYRPVDSE